MKAARPPQRTSGWLTTVALVTFLAVAGPVLYGSDAPADQRDPARSYLVSAFNLTDPDLQRVQLGDVVVRPLTPTDPREFAVSGIVRIRVTPEFYVNHLAEIARFKRAADGILQVGTFGNPPTLDDVGSLTLDDADLRSLRNCRVGHCGVQLSADAINRLHDSLDWRRADATVRANGLMRQILVDYVASYQKEGASASMLYADQSEPLSLSREFATLVEATPAVWQAFPTLRRHLLDYPATGSAGTIDLLYWSKEKVGRRGVASITHLAISRSTDGSPVDYAIASKHIYGTHYVDASLGLTFLLRDRSSSSPSMYLVYMNRSRVDIFGGMLGGLARTIVSSRARSTVAEELARLQTELEREFTSLPHD